MAERMKGGMGAHAGAMVAMRAPIRSIRDWGWEEQGVRLSVHLGIDDMNVADLVLCFGVAQLLL